MSVIQNEMIQYSVYALVVRGQGQDMLMGKNVHHYIKIPGLESLLNQFITDLDDAFNYIYDNDISNFLMSLEKKFKISFKELKENLTNNLSEMIESESDDIMLYYLVITKTLEFIRQKIYERDFIKEFILYYESKFNKKPDNSIFKKFSSLDSENQEAISLLYNLIFTRYLAKIYKQKTLENNINKIIKNQYEKLIKKTV